MAEQPKPKPTIEQKVEKVDADLRTADVADNKKHEELGKTVADIKKELATEKNKMIAKKELLALQGTVRKKLEERDKNKLVRVDLKENDHLVKLDQAVTQTVTELETPVAQTPVTVEKPNPMKDFTESVKDLFNGKAPLIDRIGKVFATGGAALKDGFGKMKDWFAKTFPGVAGMLGMKAKAPERTQQEVKAEKKANELKEKDDSIDFTKLEEKTNLFGKKLNYTPEGKDRKVLQIDKAKDGLQLTYGKETYDLLIGDKLLDGVTTMQVTKERGISLAIEKDSKLGMSTIVAKSNPDLIDLIIAQLDKTDGKPLELKPTFVIPKGELLGPASWKLGRSALITELKSGGTIEDEKIDDLVWKPNLTLKKAAKRPAIEEKK